MRRFSLLVLACAVALGLGSAARAGTQVAPDDGATVTDASPAFLVSLTTDDNHPKVLVARAADASSVVGTCDLQPAGGSDASQYACRLATPLAPGDYVWTLQTDYLFCDGDAGQYCDWTPRLAGPTPFTVAAPAPAPAPAPALVDTPTIVPGTAIGAIRLGMTQQQVEAAYGAPAGRRTSAVVRAGRAGADYQVHRGLLQVSYQGGRVVSVLTTSAYYRTAGGLAVGVRVGSGPAFRGYRACGGVLVQPAPTGGETQLVLSGRRVAAIRVNAAPTAC